MNRRIHAGLMAALMTVALGTAPAFAEETPKPVPISAPADSATAGLSLEGVVEFQDLEGGFYSVNGFALMGDDNLYKTLVGQTVLVQGKEFDGISTRMVRQIEVSTLARALTTNQTALPSAVTVNGKALAFDQGPVVVDGTLMVPLRAIAEAAGGKVTWNDSNQSIHVSLADRETHFYVGQTEAEMSMRGVNYIRRNMLPISKAPVVQNGRTLISIDAVTASLGLYENVDTNSSMDLITVQK